MFGITASKQLVQIAQSELRETARPVHVCLCPNDPFNRVNNNNNNNRISIAPYGRNFRGAEVFSDKLMLRKTGAHHRSTIHDVCV